MQPHNSSQSKSSPIHKFSLPQLSLPEWESRDLADAQAAALNILEDRGATYYITGKPDGDKLSDSMSIIGSMRRQFIEEMLDGNSKYSKDQIQAAVNTLDLFVDLLSQATKLIT